MSCTGSCHGHINFTSRGKLLLIDIEKAKRDEFQRRRKLRLQQVRQQSNEIAREIRDKVKAEKTLKGSKEELKRLAHFKTWKESQMKTLQDEFNRRAVVAEQDKENALKEKELVELEKERQQVLDEIAKKRGNLAVLKQRREKLAVETDSFLKTSNAKFNRSLENLRSALVSSLPKPDSKKAFTEPKSSLDRRFDSVDSTLHRKYEGEVSTSGTVQDHESVMRIISSDDNSIKKPLTSSLDTNTLASCHSTNFGSSRYSPEKVSLKYSVSPERQSYPTSPKKPVIEETKPLNNPIRGPFHPTYSPHSMTSLRESRSVSRPTVTSHSASRISPRKGFQGETSYSPGKRLASNVLMSPSKRVAGSSHHSHSVHTSPVRCKYSYSPNRFKDESENSHTNHVRGRQVRFENVPSPDESSIYRSAHGRSRTLSECDSEVSFGSDVTWPPRNWNRHQDEEVILYDHCGRSTSKYLPKHTVSIIPNELVDNGLEEEIEACRERAIKRHEEDLRERRGCRALYRQRLRSEFSCMISDLAKLDKKTRLAKLESEAKAALLTKKQGKRLPPENDNKKDKVEVEKADTPGNVKVMECIDPMEVDDSDRKIVVEMTSQDVMDCNLNALDRLMETLIKKRDHLLACHQHEEESAGGEYGTVQSKSVQCSTRPSVDMATSPRETNPMDTSTDLTVNRKESRATSPIGIDFNSVIPPDCEEERNLKKPSQKDPAPISEVHGPKSSTPTKIVDERYQVTPELLEHKKNKSVNKASSSHKSLESSVNDSKLISPIKISDNSKSSGSVDASCYSFEGVKVEVKVTRNKSTKLEMKEKVKTDTKKPLKDSNLVTLDMPDSQAWAKKLSENDSSGGTSYMSPPDELNPDEHKLLISVLEGMDKKNSSNPVLRMYIQKLLSMSKGSLENMSISVSDDSTRSESFRTCFENNSEVDNKQSASHKSFTTVRSDKNVVRTNEDFNAHTVLKKVISEPVKKILESDEGSVCNGDIRRVSSQPVEVIQESRLIDKTLFMSALKQCNDRLRKLAKTMREPPLQSGESDTTYLNLPSSVCESIKLSESLKDFGLICPEMTVEHENNEDITPDLGLPPGPSASTWGDFPSIFPNHEFESNRTLERRPKPPSTINNYTSRGMIGRDEVLQHELSTIAEADSKLLSSQHPICKQQQSSMESGQNFETSVSPFEEKISEDIFHTLPPTGLPLPSDTSFISSTHVSPVKPAEESSLHIFSELPDSSFGQSSAEEVAVSEVFRSLGIGWALSTWRKTHEASKKKEESSSSSPSDAVTVSKRKSDDLRCRHSTPIKTSDAEKNIKMLEDDSDNLTPPSVNLYPRYQNLIRSASEISSSSDS